MWIKRLFAAIWDLVMCFLSFFAGFLVFGVIGAMTFGFIYPDVEQVPEPWSTRIIYLALIGGIALAVVVWTKRRRRQNAKSATVPIKQPGMEPLSKVQNDFASDAYSCTPETLHSDLIKEDQDAELRRIDNMEGHEFEHWCAALLRKIGFVNVVVTQGSGDQGVDVLAEKDGIRYAIQCKCYSKDLGNKPVQEVNSGKQMPEYRCQIGAVMTNRHFTKGAKDLAAATGTLLWDRDWIANHLHGQPLVTPNQSSGHSAAFNDDGLIEKTIDVLMDAGYVSASILQQKLGLEFSEAEQVLKILEDQELVSHPDGRGFRSLLITQELWSIYKKSHAE